MIVLKGYHDSDPPLPAATTKRGTCGPDYVSTSRKVSDYSGQYDQALGLLRKSLGGIEKIITGAGEHERGGNRWLTGLASLVGNGRDGSESLEQAMKRLVLRGG